MNSRSLEMTDLPPRHHRGFALVVTLSLMVLLTVIAVGLLTMSASTTRSSNSEQTQAAARANAKIGLMLALSELQKAAGPDQRVTSQADVLTNSQPAMLDPARAGRSRWLGVWNTSAYSPATPDTKTFVRWLVSSDETAATATTLTTPSTRGSDPAATSDVEIFKGRDTSGAAVPTNSVKVPKVQIRPGASTDPKHYYAYWVEDEGVKADLGWKEADSTNTAERQQAARLTAAPGVDYGVFGGPFTSQVVYPITKNPSTTNPWLANIDKALSPADMPLVMSASSNQSNWLKSVRHDVTLGSRGVMVDVKKGGLRRDLSLAFEMDGTADVTADVTSRPTKFNLQDGEFVGGNDRLTAPQAAQGMGGIKERFLYRDTQGSGTPFSGSIQTAAGVIRGPNWWSLRDYANLYKRLSGSNGNYTLPARSYYPNVSSLSGGTRFTYTLGNATGANANSSPASNNWDFEIINQSNITSGYPYVFRPARCNYAPVLLGSVCLFSAIATQSDGTTAKLGLGIDPLFYLWNPYNRTLKVDKFAVMASYGFPGHVTLYVKSQGDPEPKQYGPATARDYLNAYALGTNPGRSLTYLVSNLTMAPGEIVVVSPSSSRSASANTINDEATPGTNTDNASGLILTKIPVTDPDLDPVTLEQKIDPLTKKPIWKPTVWKEVPLTLATDTVKFTYSNEFRPTNLLGQQVIGTNWFWLRTYLPASTMIASSLVNSNNLGDEVQAIDSNTLGSITIREYYWPSQNQVVTPLGPYAAATLVDTKNFFGIVSYLAKPASFSGTNPNPVEVFSQFNPAPVGSTLNEMWRPCTLNQIYNMVSKAGDVDTLLQECGINFPAARDRNGFWGASYASGSTSLPMTNIPSAPIFSLASFSHAALSIRTSEPYHAVGNSWASLFVSPVSPYGTKYDDRNGNYNDGNGICTASDSSWLINDALFDRYYLSGIAPAYTIGSGGYSPNGTPSDTLTKFFSSDYKSALANPVLRPYLPPGEAAASVVTALAANDGYKKMGAYSLIDGAFNVNSTSVSAWTGLLRASRNLAVTYAQGGGSDTASGSPFPKGQSPSAPGNGAQAYWSGFSRLTDPQIDSLATEIVNQVKKRGPFMSLSDFINHRVGTPKTTESYMGALQAAIEAANINFTVKAGASGVDPIYTGTIANYIKDTPPVGTRKTTTGIPADITQADLLLPLAPRLTARSDTFRIRSYGEVRSSDGNTILSQATCETIVQRVPEYVDSTTDAANNEPWDEAAATGTTLNATNLKYGRRFRVVQTRWLTPNEL